VKGARGEIKNKAEGGKKHNLNQKKTKTKLPPKNQKKKKGKEKSAIG